MTIFTEIPRENREEKRGCRKKGKGRETGARGKAYTYPNAQVPRPGQDSWSAELVAARPGPGRNAPRGRTIGIGLRARQPTPTWSTWSAVINRTSSDVFSFSLCATRARCLLRMSTGEASRDDDATTSSSEITLCATQTAPLPRHRHPAACTHAPPACVSDPPLGKFPPWSFQHPVLVGASARWRAGGGSAGLIALLKCEPISPRPPPAARRLAHSRHVAPGTAKTSRPFGRSCASRA